MTLKAYQYRLYPNSGQADLIWRHANHNRGLYNRMLALRMRYYKIYGKGPSDRQIQDHVVKLKRRPATAWLAEVNSQSLLATLGNLSQAYSSFFKGKTKFPRFKSKRSNWHSYANPQKVQVLDGFIKLPKIGLVKAKIHRDFEGKIKTCTVKISPTGKFTISVLVDDGREVPVPTTIQASQSMGLDMGIKVFLADSAGGFVDNPRHLNQKLEKLAKAQRMMARKKKGSKSRARQRLVVARLHEQVANCRKDFLHQVSARLVRENQTTIFCEDLAVKNMSRNPKLARHILDAGWSKFFEILAYKQADLGKNLVRINRFLPSTQQCRQCGHKHSAITLSDRTFDCPNCGHTEDRDTHSAKQIRQFGLLANIGMGLEQPSP